MHLNPADLPQKDAYKLLIGAVQPRPIAWVSTSDKAGRLNLAPYSFFTGVSTRPLTLCFSAQFTASGEKDTLANIRDVPEFVVNIPNEATAAAMSRSAALLARGVSEFEYADLTPAASKTIGVPRVAEAPFAFECKLHQIVEVGSGPGGGALIIGEVTHIYVDDAVYVDGYIVREQFRPIGRLAGNNYVRVTDVFNMDRG